MKKYNACWLSICGIISCFLMMYEKEGIVMYVIIKHCTLPPGQAQMLSGIDPRYLTSYSDNSAQFIVTGQTMQGQSAINNTNIGMDYHNQNFTGPDISNVIILPPKVSSTGPSRTEATKAKQLNVYDDKNNKGKGKQECESHTCASVPKSTEKEPPKSSGQSKAMSRLNKIDVLYKRGLLVFSGPVEKVLKWHKLLQDIGVLALYEVVAKCVSVSPGDFGAKNLVVRDENGPAMQVVYYEIDFQLPEMKLPCTVRVVGKMIAGTCRLQAFKVRPAIGDDVAMLPRRAAVSAHHITKLSKEIGNI